MSCCTVLLTHLLLRAADGGESDKFEAYRELGTALHTLEDFLAHCRLREPVLPLDWNMSDAPPAIPANYLELALNKLGNREVFCHVGDNVRIRSPNGQNVPPLYVFAICHRLHHADVSLLHTMTQRDRHLRKLRLHDQVHLSGARAVTSVRSLMPVVCPCSVLGEVNDKLSSSTVDDLNGKFSDAKKQQNSGNNGSDLLKNLLNKIPSGSKDEAGVNNKIANVEEIRRKAVNIDPCVLR